MRHFTFYLFILFLFISSVSLAQTDSTSKPVKKEKIKKGWTFGALPVVAYDADMGFQYGALAQFFDYGDGTIYPEYRHTFYVEVSRFTKGSGVNQLFYDSKYLIPGHIRITADLDYLTERALDFFGFNGYEANYERNVTREESDDYISRVYYKHERFMLRAMADFQGRIIGERFRWLAGVNYFNIKTATVDIERMNKGKKEDKQLPDTMLLYDEYVKYGLIGEDEKNGGSHAILKIGLIYDTRDNEAAPNKGIWSEILLMAAPAFMSNTSHGFTQLAVAHRQFFTLYPKQLVFAYRLAYQGTIGGTAPFYIQPYLFSSYALTTKPDGLGGSRTIRGVMRNRVVGDGAVNANLELRWKFWKTYLFKQNFYLQLIGFFDAGMVVQDRPVDRSKVTENPAFYFDLNADRPHFGTGLGLRAALNENFIISVDYGFALDHRDGTSGLYIGIGNIF
jgi:outer membrane protein assembly factor BamA